MVGEKGENRRTLNGWKVREMIKTKPSRKRRKEYKREIEVMTIMANVRIILEEQG